MGKYLQRCEELRGDTSRHYGCSQAVFIPFAEQMGLDSETANAISANFRAGMLTGRVCGAVTGALMALGLAGASPKAAMELQSRDCPHVVNRTFNSSLQGTTLGVTINQNHHLTSSHHGSHTNGESRLRHFVDITFKETAVSNDGISGQGLLTGTTTKR